MKMALLFVLLYYVMSLLFFLLIQRPLFILYNRKCNTEKMSLKDLRDIYRHGIKTDMITASYLTVLPMLLFWIHAHFPYFRPTAAFVVCHILLALIAGVATVADTAIYRFWLSKLDASALTYLRSLKGTFASVSTQYIILAFCAWFLVSGIYFCSVSWVSNLYAQIPAPDTVGWMDHLIVFIGFLLIVGCLFIIIRGLNIRPNTPSIAYYSKNPFYNHCAVNPIYNIVYTLSSIKDPYANKFRYYDSEEARKLSHTWYPTQGTPQTKILRTERPNILLIVWESLSAKHIGCLGGDPNVCVQIDRLSREGVLFTHCDAGSFRTDRGLVCLLSGYLGQPTASVIKYPKKLAHLPGLPRTLKQYGYTTTAVHGGDLSIMHKSTYYLTCGHDTLVSQDELPKTAPTCKWGIHDGYMFDWIYEDIQKKTRENKQWFTTLQTLSSHEPFEVPYDRIKDNKIANSFAYTDDCFGRLIDKLKASPAWDNLLVICTGDHGINAGKPEPIQQYCHIPMLLLGGALKQPMQIHEIMAQTDQAATLLGQMNIPHEYFTYSRDVLADTYTFPFSFHTYNNGFLVRDQRGYTHYDNIADRVVAGEDVAREKMGKVIEQCLYEDLSKK